jgi:hypothetical protein
MPVNLEVATPALLDKSMIKYVWLDCRASIAEALPIIRLRCLGDGSRTVSQTKIAISKRPGLLTSCLHLDEVLNWQPNRAACLIEMVFGPEVSISAL